MKQLFKFSIVMMVLLACHRDSVNFIGPAYISAPDGFAVTSFTSSTTSIDFTAGTVNFNAAFTSKVSWILTIKGQQSGAVHVVTGIANGFSNIVWTGKNDEVTLFRSGETAIATLSFYGTSLAPSIAITILVAPDYTTYGSYAKYGDFETPSQVIPTPPNHYSPYFASFNFPTPIPNESQGIDSMAIDYHGNPVPSVQGRKYYYIKGLGNQSVFVSGLQYIGGITPSLPPDPNNVWVNLYIYGTGDPNAMVTLDYQETDGTGNPYQYEPAKDDAYVATITLSHKGWKLFSFKYSDLPASTDPNFGGSGNKIHEPNLLVSYDLVLLKGSNPNSPVEVYFDYPIITVGGPFKPL